MATPIRDKVFLWRSSRRGIKSRLTSDVDPPAIERDDIPDVVVSNKLKRGDTLQKLRLRFYPSINVDKDKLYAGEIQGDLSDVESKLLELGFRNNPTAYVEVTEDHGPDDGSYSLQQISETGGRLDLPRISQQPSFWKRTKLQTHVTVYELQDRSILLAHKELSAWLQPARHVWKGDASARIGVRDFRDMWFDEFDEELSGKDKVAWDTTH